MKTEDIEKSHSNLLTTINLRRSRLQKFLLNAQDFDKTFQDFLGAVDDLEKRLANEKPLDARFEELRLVNHERQVSAALFSAIFCKSNILRSEPCFLALKSAHAILTTIP